MDISIIGKNSIKIKGKQATFIVDPTKEVPKTSADAIILLNGNNGIDVTRVNDSRITLDGPGGYEVGGVKISGLRTPKGVLYNLAVDNVVVILGSATDVKTEGYNTCQVAIVNTNIDFNEAFVTTLEPKWIVLYGDKKVEAAKALGATSVSSISKITITKDKLPEKMEIITLG